MSEFEFNNNTDKNTRHEHADLLIYAAENKDADFYYFYEIKDTNNRPKVKVETGCIIDVLANPSKKWWIKAPAPVAPKTVTKWQCAYMEYGQLQITDYLNLVEIADSTKLHAISSSTLHVLGFTAKEFPAA